MSFENTEEEVTLASAKSATFRFLSLNPGFAVQKPTLGVSESLSNF